MIRFSSLFGRILQRLVLSFLLIALFTYTIAMLNLNRTLKDETVSKAVAISTGITQSLIVQSDEKHITSVLLLINEYVDIDGVSYIYITKPNKEILMHTFTSGWPDDLVVPTKTGTTIACRDIKLSNENILEIVVPVSGGVDGYIYLGMSKDHIRTQIISAFYTLGYTLLFIVLIIWPLALWLRKHIFHPLSYVEKAAAVVASGELSEPVAKAYQNNEIASLQNAIRTMTLNLKQIVGQVQQSTVHLSSTSTELETISRHQASLVNHFSSSTTQIVASAKEITSTSAELSNTMENVSESTSKTSDIAVGGSEHLFNMELAIKDLGSDTRRIGTKLNHIKDKASKITSVITTISKVAEQTNMLSFNAAIEAERAGEAGKGFTIVAREIRRLADQTAVANLDIEKSVNEFFEAIDTGVRDVHVFNAKVDSNIQHVIEFGTRLQDIINSVETLMPQFSKVNEGMRAQAEGAGQITQSMEQLQQMVVQTNESLKEFVDATQTLNLSVSEMRDNISHFRIKMEGDNEN